MNDRQVEALADRAEFYADHYASKNITQAELREFAAALRSRTPSAPDVAMREALRPFAVEADNWHSSVPDSHRSLCTGPGSKTAYPGSETSFTVGDIRRAKIVYNALSASEAKAGEPDANCVTLPNGDCVGVGCMHDAPTPAVDREAVARIVEGHLDSHTFEKNDDGSVVIDRAGMILTISEDERLALAPIAPAQEGE